LQNNKIRGESKLRDHVKVNRWGGKLILPINQDKSINLLTKAQLLRILASYNIKEHETNM